MDVQKEFAKKGTKHLKEVFREGYLPRGILAKGRTGCGGTTLALESEKDYIIFVPTIEIIKNKLFQYPENERTNNRIYIIPVYAEIKDDGIRSMIIDAREEDRPVKIMATYNSIERLCKIEEANLFNTCILVDEFHDLMVSYSYKSEVVEKLINLLSTHPHVTYMSSTPLTEATCPLQLRDLPVTEVEWEEIISPIVHIKRSPTPIITVRKYLNLVCFDNALALAQCPVTGEYFPPDEYFIYINNVKQIANIIKMLPWVEKDEIRVVCRDEDDNLDTLGEFADCLGSISEKRKYNFLTRRAFYGCDVYSERGIAIVVTNNRDETSLLDVAIDIKQILGRIRNNDNPFKNNLIHIFNSRINDLSKEELDAIFRPSDYQIPSSNSQVFNKYRNSFIKNTYQTENNLKAAYIHSGFEVKNSTVFFRTSELDEMKSSKRFEELLEEYCERTADGENINDIPGYLRVFCDEFVNRAVNQLGRKRLKELSYKRAKIEQELNFLDGATQIEIFDKVWEIFEIGSEYSFFKIKKLLTDMFFEIGLTKKVTATLINDYFVTEVINIYSEKGKRVKGYKIIAKKQALYDSKMQIIKMVHNLKLQR